MSVNVRLRINVLLPQPCMSIPRETALQEARTNRYISQQGNQDNQVVVSQLKEMQKIRKEQAKVRLRCIQKFGLCARLLLLAIRFQPRAACRVSISASGTRNELGRVPNRYCCVPHT
jgi:hypothetical protein